MSSRRSRSWWRRALAEILADRLALACLSVFVVFLIAALGVWAGLWGEQWSTTSAAIRAPISVRHWFGTNAIGQDIFARCLYSARTAFEVGLLVAIVATGLGALLGALAGYYNARWPDRIAMWLMGVIDAIPFYLLVAAVAYAMRGNPFAMHIAMVACFWTTTGRLIRAEVIKLKQLSFVEAARVIGVSEAGIIFHHILPNTTHLVLIQATISFVAAVKAEVVLSFLGLGVKDGVSWGVMIAESARDNLAGHFNNFIAASVSLFLLVMALNLLADVIQDVLDPRRGQRP